MNYDFGILLYGCSEDEVLYKLLWGWIMAWQWDMNYYKDVLVDENEEL